MAGSSKRHFIRVLSAEAMLRIPVHDLPACFVSRFCPARALWCFASWARCRRDREADLNVLRSVCAQSGALLRTMFAVPVYLPQVPIGNT